MLSIQIQLYLAFVLATCILMLFPGPNVALIVANERPAVQVILLAATFLFIGIVIDGTWAMLAGRARGILAILGKLRNRLSGSLLIGAGVGLALARRK
jgi:threonine/homoserine/homoserine lactone efflux protein